MGRIRNSRLVLSPADPEAKMRSVVTTWGLGADVQAAVTDRVGFVGEFFVGQGPGEYNGGISQTFNSTTARAAGGFGEAYCYFTDQLHLHAGYGVDAPVARDLAPTQIARNQTYSPTWCGT